jgi:hypothetical protein
MQIVPASLHRTVQYSPLLVFAIWLHVCPPLALRQSHVLEAAMSNSPVALPVMDL